MEHVSTSYAERNNLNIRMHSRRMTRLTNAFSKKMENHAHAMALHFLYYNFVRIHKTLKVTPAMAAGVTDRLWEVTDMVNVLESMGGVSMNWDKAIATVRPHVVKIATPAGYRTGFLAFSNHDQTWCGIATAAHVVKHADEWQEPIRIQNPTSFKFLKFEERVIFLDNLTDSAVVLFLKGDLQLPETPIALMPADQPCGIGIDLGWLGYPAIEPDTLCFFAGVVSARLEVTKAYLVDGVSIHGISGGPVFHCPSPTSDDVQVIGCVSAYHANRATGEALPD